MPTPPPSAAPVAPRAPRRDAADNRTALLTAARALLSRDPATPLDAIAAEAGLSKRAMYGHFASRDALLDALARSGAERVVAAVSGIDEADPVIRLTRIAAAAWDDVDTVRSLLVLTVRSPRLAQVEDALEPLRSRLTATIAEGADAGAIRRDIAPDRLARLLVDAVIGVFAETAASDLDRDAGRSLVVTMSLSAAGLGWREIEALLAARPELVA